MPFQQRHSEPIALRRIWKAIDMIRGQRQIANIARLTKVLQRDYPYRSKDIMAHILRAIRDKMVIETLSLGCKGSKAGLEQEGYWIPEDSDIREMAGLRDCYCFTCHKPGKLITCVDCHKAYHKQCVDTCLENVHDNSFRCRFCSRKDEKSFSRKELNVCLHFIVRRAIEAATDLNFRPSPTDYMHFQYFISDHQTLKSLVDDCNSQKFETTSDFEQQLYVILHNCIVLEGHDSSLSKEAKKIVDICQREIRELELCPNCYLLSNTKPTKNWFCLPCMPAHKVLWAKQKGFEYWPAKVIQIVNGKIDVRFFGGHHERAWVTTQSVRKITVSPAELNIKKTKGWTKASEEMKQYIAQTEIKLDPRCSKSIIDFELPSDSLSIGAVDQKNRNEISPTSCKRLDENQVSDNEMDIDPCPNGTSLSVTDASDESKQNHRKSTNDHSDEPKCNGYQSNGVKKRERRPLWKMKGEKCNCRKIYAKKLFLYQSSVRRMRLNERRNNLMISARFIHQYLKKHSDKMRALVDENAKLKVENTDLKSRLETSQNGHLEAKASENDDSKQN